MRTPLLIGMAALSILSLSGCAWTQLGSLTMISTRNVDSSKDYQLLAKDVEVKARAKGNGLQVAVDRAVAMKPGGECMMNLSVYVNGGGGYVKVKGDVWGIPQASGVATTVETGLRDALAIGDKVLFKLPGSTTLRPGTVKGLQKDKAVIEYEHTNTKGTEVRLREIPFDRITKVE